MSEVGLATLDCVGAHSLSIAEVRDNLLPLTICRSEFIRLNPVSGRPGAVFGSNWHGRPSAISR
jgi:hypothetical protein